MHNNNGWNEEKIGTGTLIAHRGGRIVDRGGLVGLHTPEGTQSWRPVPHSELVDSLLAGFSEHKITVLKDRYCVSGQNDARLMGVLELEIPHLATPDYNMILGIRGANDQSWAISAVAGVHVFCCDNEAFAGDSGVVVLKRKHTSRLDLAKVVPGAIEAYLERAGQFVLDIKSMQEYELDETRAKALIYDAFVQDPVMNRRLFPVVDALYFRDDRQKEMFPDRTLWSLNQSFTEAVKALPPVTQDRSSRAIGRFFARVANKGKAPQLGWDVPAEDADDDAPLQGELFPASDFID